ncbi:MAG: flagellin [Steroidobacteraceae bacterium]
MSLVLNTNIDSLLAQNSLSSSGSQLATALQQLSSGLRINTAADDAAGYAISQGITSQINGMNQAQQNANDGVSLAQTASGALQGVVNDLQSMRDLAVESLNASNGANDRADLNAQFQQLMNDINSVSTQTQFNGVNLLDGTFQGATFQVGANVGQSITMASIANTSSSAIGNYYTGATSVSGTLTTSGGVKLNTVAGTAGSYNATTLAGATGLNTAVDGASVSLDVQVDGTSYATSAITLTGTKSTDLKSIAAAVNQALSSAGGLTATVNSAGSGIQISGTAANGAGNLVNFSVASATSAGGTSIAAGTGTLAALGVDSSDIVGYYTPSAAAGSQVVTGGGNYASAALTTALTGTKALGNVPTGGNTGQVTIGLTDGTNNSTISVAITGDKNTDLNAIKTALNANATFTGDGFSAAVGTNGIVVSGSGATSYTMTYSVSSATNTTGGAATPALTDLGLDATDTWTAGSPGTDSNTVAGTYSMANLDTAFKATVTPAATTPGSVKLGVSINSGTVINTAAISIDAIGTNDQANLISALNTTLAGSGFTASAGLNNNITVTGSGGENATVAFSVVTATDAAGNSASTTGLLTDLGVDGSVNYTAGAAGAQATTGNAQFLSALNVNTVDNSNLVLISVDNALQQIATVSADVGAYQNRFQAAITSLTTDSTNLTAAKSAIVDADYASATSNLSKAQILQQASTAMVAQANTIPQNILTLLQKLP